MLSSSVMLILGFAVLLMGAHWLVKGAGSLAKRLNVPQIVIGLTVVAFGTSTPELIVNVIAALKGSPDISFGNVIGSNNLNIYLVLGISALLCPLALKRDTTYKEIPFALLTSFVLLLMANDRWFDPSAVNLLSRGDGFILIGLFVLFMLYAHNLSKHGNDEKSDIKSFPLLLIIAYIVAGLAGLVLGGHWVVKYAVIIAQEMGISEKIIALTIVALGTSLPEMATSVLAAFKKQPDIAIGNVVGSCIFNLLLIMGVTSLIRPPQYSVSFNPDQYMMILSMVLLFSFVVLPKRHCLQRWQGGMLLIVYALYAAFIMS